MSFTQGQPSDWAKVNRVLEAARCDEANFGEMRRNFREGDPPLLTALLIEEERGKIATGRLCWPVEEGA